MAFLFPKKKKKSVSAYSHTFPFSSTVLQFSRPFFFSRKNKMKCVAVLSRPPCCDLRGAFYNLVRNRPKQIMLCQTAKPLLHDKGKFTSHLLIFNLLSLPYKAKISLQYDHINMSNISIIFRTN
jgi:hypothetical protein